LSNVASWPITFIDLYPIEVYSSLMDATLMAYLSGCLDSDGYFTIKRDTYAMRVRGDARVPIFHERIGLKQVKSIVPDLLAKTFGGTVRVEHQAGRRNDMHVWQITDRKAAACAQELMQHLRIKWEQAWIILQLRELKKIGGTGTADVQQRDRWGQLRTFRKRVHSTEDVAARQNLFEQIKALNDTRTWQPKLG